MFWQEESEKEQTYQVPDDVVDISYQIGCRSLPLDHAHALSGALHEALDWLGEEELAGVHLIHVAESGNGWYRPEDPETQLLHLSRRTRMSLRVPKHRIDQALQLTGTELDVGGYSLTVGEGTVKTFSTLPTMFARYVLLPEGIESDEAFLDWAAGELQALGVRVRKAMPGRSHEIGTPEGSLRTRSLMVADLEPEEAVTLQQRGLGEGRKIGCGLFLPHKGIKPVKDTQ